MEEIRDSLDSKELNSGKYFEVFRNMWWKIMLLSLLIGVATLGYLLYLPNIYRSTATLTPSFEENKPNIALGALASFGVTIGGPSKVEDLETLFKSYDLTVRVFKKNNFWDIVFPIRYDLRTGLLRTSLLDRLFGSGKEQKYPDDWDAIRVMEDCLSVIVNRRAGTVSVSFDSPSPEGSAKIVNAYLEEGKSRLQEEAFNRARKNKLFIEEQISKTIDPLNKDRLFTLYGQEVEREMLARNREQFGFKIIDAPRIPDRKYKPHRAIATIMAFFLSFFLGCVFIFMRYMPKYEKKTVIYNIKQE